MKNDSKYLGTALRCGQMKSKGLTNVGVCQMELEKSSLSGFLVEETHWCLLQWWAGKGLWG